jgi:hypothetical protein
MTMLLGASTATNVTQSSKPERLMREIKADAAQVQSVAARMDKLAENSTPTWIDYDRQWNEIKPSVEDMQMKVVRLEAMQSSLTPAERKELDQSKLLVGEIQSRTHQFLTLLDTPGIQTTDAKFKTYARSLRNEAGSLEKLAPAS